MASEQTETQKEIVRQVRDLLGYFPGRGGVALVWLIILPLLSFLPLLSSTFMFGNVAHLPIGGVPYTVFAFHGQCVFWLYSISLIVMLLRINHSDRSSWIDSATIIASSVAYGVIICFPALVLGIVVSAFYAGISFSSVLQTLFGVFEVIGSVLLLAAIFGAIAHRIGFLTPLILVLAKLFLWFVPVGFSIAIVPETWRFRLAAIPLTPATTLLRNGILNLPFDAMLFYGVMGAIHAILGCSLAFWFWRKLNNPAEQKPLQPMELPNPLH